MADNVKLDTLEIEIVDNASQAAKNLTELKNVIKDLVPNGAKKKLDSYISSLKELKDVPDTDVSDRLSRFADALSKLANVPKLQISKTTANQITAIGAAVIGLPADYTKLTNLATALGGFEKIKGINLKSFVDGIGNIPAAFQGIVSLDQSTKDKVKEIADTFKAFAELGDPSGFKSIMRQLPKLPEIMQNLKDADFETFEKQIIRLHEILKPFADDMDKIANGFNSFPSKIQKLVKSTNAFNEATSKKNPKKFFEDIFNSIKGMKNLITTAFVGLTGSRFFKESSDFVETLNLFNVTMRKGTADAYAYAEQVQNLMGVDIKDWMDFQGKFQNMATGYGVIAENAAIMSKNLTQLSYDLSSVFNVDTTRAAEKLQSAMSGQVKSLKEWGVDVSVASMKEYALSKGITQSWKSLSVASQAMLRYNYILEKTTALQGDLGRTLQTPANAVRILKAQITQLERAIGNIVSLVVTKAMPYFQAFIELLKEAATELANLWGYDPNSFVDWSNLDTTGATESIEETAEAANELKRTLLGFDEINALNGNSGSGNGGLSPEDLGISLNEYDFLQSIDRSKVDAAKDVLHGFVDFIKDIAEGIGKIWAIAIEPLLDFFVTDGFEGFALISGAFGVLNGIKYGKVAGGIGSIASAFLLSVDAGKKFYKALKGDTDSVWSALTDLVGGAVAGAIGGFLVGGPVGALIGGLGALATAFLTAKDDDYKFKKQLLDTQIYDNNGKKIQDLQADIENYLGTIGLGLDEQQKWIDKIKATEDAYKNASEKYDILWQQLDTKKEWSTTDIDNLSAAFNELADSIKAVRDARIDSAMQNISNAIKNNISPQLTSMLDDLNEKIAVFQLYSDAGIKGLEDKYQKLLKEIMAQDGTPSVEQKEELGKLRTEISKYSLSGIDTGTWTLQRDNALEDLVNAGTNYEEVQKALNNFISSRDEYIKTAEAKYGSDLTTLMNMIALDQQEGWGIFDGTEIDDFKQSWQNQKAIINNEFNKVLEQYLSQLEKQLDPVLGQMQGTTAYGLGQSLPLFWNLEYGSGRIKPGLLGWFDNEFVAANESYNEMVDLIKLIKSATSHAVGGFPEDGLFFANHNELVGKFVNGRTAVANNEQIIEGIKRGVAEANRESAGDGNWTIQILDPNGNITGETIITAAERRNRRDGKTVISIGAN